MLRKFFIFIFVLSLTMLFSGCGEEEEISGPGEIENGDENGNGDDPEDEDEPETAIAFPGAEGGGMYATGGRGGEVYVVNTLEDGFFEGTFRWAIGQTGPRIIIFSVSGTIYLDTELKINSGDVTIAGQSSPGGGITLANYPVTVSADNVIIRFLRFRLGDVKAVEGDAIWGRYHKNIIIDHCSMSWSTDECASFYANEDFTMQWCVIAESLNESVHGKGAHGYGGLWGGYNATFHHNLLAHHKSRNPRFYGVRDGIERERAEMVNNVIYNWGDNSAYGGEAGEYNIVNNYYKPGPATENHRDRIFEAYYLEAYGKFYVEGNYVHGSSSVTDDNWLGIDLKSGGDKNDLVASQPFNITPVEYTSAAEAYQAILEHGGASLYRDEVDERVVDEVFNATATYGGVYGDNLGIIDTQETVGGWPELQSGSIPDDTDNDGMPDSWETENGLNPNDSSDASGNDLDENYSNIEIYLNEIVVEKTGFGN